MFSSRHILDLWRRRKCFTNVAKWGKQQRVIVVYGIWRSLVVSTKGTKRVFLFYTRVPSGFGTRLYIVAPLGHLYFCISEYTQCGLLYIWCRDSLFGCHFSLARFVLLVPNAKSESTLDYTNLDANPSSRSRTRVVCLIVANLLADWHVRRREDAPSSIARAAKKVRST